MQHIQWFPGHMTKAVRMMEDNLKLCDGVLYILDARAAFGCINETVLRLFSNKPILYLLNKADLVEKKDVKAVVDEFAKQGKTAIPTVGILNNERKNVYGAILKALAEKIAARKAKGLVRPLRLMVCGIPNTGKSTVINTLAGKKTAATGDKAGVTKGKQWIKLEELELLDTPGTMPPSFKNQIYAHHLAYIGSVNDDILDMEGLALDFIEEVQTLYPTALFNKYGAEGLTPIEIYESIAAKRGFLMRGGEIDYSRTATALIDDFRKGKIAKICFERAPIKYMD